MQDSARALWEAARPSNDHAIDATCPAPWVSIEFDPSGWVYACCSSALYPLGRIGDDRLKDLWGGPRARVMREALEAWDLTVACVTCRWHLEHGRHDPVAAVYDQYPVRSPDPAQPHMMLFALSNRCNLGCVMCTPELSTTLRHEAGLAPIESRYDDTFYDDLRPLLAELKLVKFLGGEPFLAPEHKRVWSMLDELDEPPRMQVTTNGTVWTEYVEWLLERFQMDISISIDAATADTYAAIRRGGDFDQLMTNIVKFSSACRRRGTEFHVSYCLMRQNASELADFLVWAEQFSIPASINLVTDLGLAIHDDDLPALRSLRQSWAEDERRVGDALDMNRSIWNTQVAQLETVIAELEAGHEPAQTQAQPVTAADFTLDHRPAAQPRRLIGRRRSSRSHQDVVRHHIGRLERWSGTGPVAVLALDAEGFITAVTAPHERLGILASVVIGDDLPALVKHMEVADGRRAWLLDRDQLDGYEVRTIALCHHHPERGSVAAVVRTVLIPAPGGWTALVAEDRIYDRQDTHAGATPVVIGRGPSA